MKETWKPVVGYESVYSVSSLGNIRRTYVDTKISEVNIVFAHSLRESGWCYREIAEKFGISKQAMISAMTRTRKREPLRNRNRLLRPQKNSAGYVMVRLCQNGIAKSHHIHILVMRAFVGPCPEGNSVNHINGKKDDPRLDNLEYVTHSRNCIHAYSVLGIPGTAQKGEANGNALVKAAQVKEIRELSSQGVRGSDIAKRFGVHRDTVYAIIHRKSWRHI